MIPNMWFAYAMMWLSVALAIGVGIFVTGSFNCLWFLLVPLFVNMSCRKDDGGHKNG